MKKGSTVIKIIASCLVIIFGLFTIYLGCEPSYYYYDPSGYSYNPTISLGNYIENIVNESRILLGVLTTFLGIYLLGCALSTVEKKNKSQNKRKSEEANISEMSVASENDAIKMLENYKGLLDSGIITQEEFDTKKKQLLSL